MEQFGESGCKCAMADVVAPADRFLPCPTLPSDAKHWTMGISAEVKKVGRVGP